MSPQPMNRQRAIKVFLEGCRVASAVSSWAFCLSALTLTTSLNAEIPEKIPLSRIRRAILAEHTFTEPPKPLVIRESPATSDPKGQADYDTLTMETVTVEGTRVHRDLHADVLKAGALKASSTSRLGTGTRQKDLGKVRASVTTLFYIPVNAGISW